jgi:response regulator RpfG family c-di-GMP phosphodiesterase
MAVTAYSARGDEERIRAAGAQAYVSKPISVVRFAETVEELLGRSATRSTGPRTDESASWANEMAGPGRRRRAAKKLRR